MLRLMLTKAAFWKLNTTISVEWLLVKRGGVLTLSAASLEMASSHSSFNQRVGQTQGLSIKRRFDQ